MSRVSIEGAHFCLSLPKWNDKQLEVLPQICVAGRSNVGKSSLLNALTGMKGLARTSSTPGRTQALVTFRGTIGVTGARVPFHLVDLPGYGYAKVSRDTRAGWRPMMASFFEGNPRIACCLQLIDIRRVPNDDDLDLLEMMNNAGHAVLPVVTKIDKVPKTRRTPPLKEIAAALGLDDHRLMWVTSVEESIGIQELLVELHEQVVAKQAAVRAASQPAPQADLASPPESPDSELPR
jgi:GTP-binding protein